MTRTFRGTVGNDSFVGDDRDTNIFTSIGSGSDKAVGGGKNDIFQMVVDHKTDIVDGGAGRDLIDYSKSSVGLTIDLANGSAKANFNPLLQVTVTEIQNVEDVVGSRFDDTITGSSSDNSLDGGAGNDEIHAGAGNDTLIGGTGTNILDGGRGSDTADYSSAAHSVHAILSQGSATQADFPAGEIFAQDTLISIENITGSRFDDFLVGSSGDNVMNGGDGDDFMQGLGGSDTIHGDGGDDYLIAGSPGSTGQVRLFGDEGDDRLQGHIGNDLLDGGTGNDDLSGQNGNDILSGGDGNDRLEGGRGGDVMNGGSGIDTLDYRYSQEGVIVNLVDQSASGGDANGDSISNIENVWGSAEGSDLLIGSSGDNVFFEEGGNDVLIGGGGHDTFAFEPLAPGSSTVTDYQVGDDRLAFVGIDGISDLAFTQTASGTLITYADHEGSIFLLGVNTQDLLQHASTDLLFTDAVEPLLGY